MKFKAFIVYGILLLAATLVLSLLIFNTDKKTIVYENLENDDTVLAKVQGSLIKSSDLKKAVDIKTFAPLENREKMARLQKVLHELVSDKILSHLASEKNIAVNETEVQREIDRLINMHGEETFNRLLSAQNMTIDEFREGVHAELIKRKLEDSIITDLKSDIAIPNEDLEDFYQQNKEMYNVSDLAHIYVQIQAPFEADQIAAAQERAMTAVNKLKKGNDFARVAKNYSDDDTTKNNGGFLGPMSRGSFALSIRDKASKLKEGEFSQTPIRIQSGFIIIKRLNSRYQQLESVKEEIRERLIEPRLSASYSSYLQEIEEEADVQYMFKFNE